MKTGELVAIEAALQNAKNVVQTLEDLLPSKIDIEAATRAISAMTGGEIVGASQGEFVAKFPSASAALRFVREFHDLTGKMLWYPEETINDEWVVKVPA